MHAWLLFKDKDTDTSNGYSFKNDLIKDLNLEIILKTMADQKESTLQILRTLMMKPLKTKEEIQYRQEIILDISKHFDHFKKIHDFLQDANKIVTEYRSINNQRRNGSKLGGASFYMDKLKCLITLTEALQSFYPFLKSENYESEGMLALIERFEKELPKERLIAIRESLQSIEFWLDGGKLVISAAFTEGMKLGNFTINQVSNLSSGLKKKTLSFMEQISKRILKTNVTVLNEETLVKQEQLLETSAVAWLLSGFDDYLEDILSFFAQFAYEASFYLACANLVVRFKELNLPLCCPVVSDHCFSYQGLYEMSLGIYFQHCPVTNSLSTEHTSLFIVTGANQGGKSTWLRSIGIAQLFMNCGMLVPALSYESKLYSNLFTHFTRQEDSAMNHGRFDEELKRMDQIIEEMTKDSMLLMNESFASTTEKEGSLIMKNIVEALYHLHIPVFMVTHLFEFTQEMLQISQHNIENNKNSSGMVFLSANRTENGTRTFQILPDIPSRTSYGLDLFYQFFEKESN